MTNFPSNPGSLTSPDTQTAHQIELFQNRLLAVTNWKEVLDGTKPEDDGFVKVWDLPHLTEGIGGSFAIVRGVAPDENSGLFVYPPEFHDDPECEVHFPITSGILY